LVLASMGADEVSKQEGAIRVVVQRSLKARLLVDAVADTWVEIGRGLVLYLSFAEGADRLMLRAAAKSLLTAPLSTSSQWTADHTDAESVIALCRKGEAQGVLIVPQASLVSKLEPGDKIVKYHRQCAKALAEELFQGFDQAIRDVARELLGETQKHDPAAYRELKAKRAAAASIPPSEFFRVGEHESKYSLFDDRGVPTHDAGGEELPKSAKKKLEKAYQGQVKKFEKAQAVPSANVGESAGTLVAASVEVADELPEGDRWRLADGACLPEIFSGTFGGRQGFELTSAGPLTHCFAF